MEKSNRNSSIELLRILSMIGVVVLHYNNSEMGAAFRYVSDGSINQLFLYFTESMFICAVDLFLIISAYFLSVTQKRSLIKLVELLLQVVLFQIAFYFLHSYLHGTHISVMGVLRLLLPYNYFVVLYSVVYIISPYINLLLNQLNRKQFKKLMCVLIALFSIWPIILNALESAFSASLLDVSTIGVAGNRIGYTIVNFVLAYFIGAFIRKMEIKLPSKKVLVGIAVLLIAIFGFSYMEHCSGSVNIISWYYHNPLVLLLAAAYFLLFKGFSFQSKVINELAKAAFTCFLVHGHFIQRIGIEKIANGNVLLLACHQFVSGIGLYLLSYVVYKVYCYCTKWLIHLLDPVCRQIELSVYQ